MQIDVITIHEDRAWFMMERMTEGLPFDKFRCDCGRVANLSEAVTATPSPYSSPICPACAAITKATP